MREKEFDYINVIPLVDVMLVLLTIVLTTSTFIAAGSIPVSLPQAARSPDAALRSLTIEVARDGLVYVRAVPLALCDLPGALAATDRETPVLIRADRGLELQGFVDVLDAVRTLGFRRVSLQTEQRG
jgi:biopolymer transport protein ExbD